MAGNGGHIETAGAGTEERDGDQLAYGEAVRQRSAQEVGDHRGDAIDGESITKLGVREGELLEGGGAEIPGDVKRQGKGCLSGQDQNAED